MAVLVGIDLIQGDAFDIVRNGKTVWTGIWTLFRSPDMSCTVWEPLTTGESAGCFATPGMAARAGEDQGVVFARELQADDGLEPISWGAAPAIATRLLKRSCRGGRC